jgi:phenylpyruvate tautomerase PptA (4-oxalocrotonate tautomerase family)
LSERLVTAVSASRARSALLLTSISADAGCRLCRNPWRCSGPRLARSYVEINRNERFILVRITLAKGRTTDAKRAFYRRLSELLADGAEVPAEGVAVIMVANGREDWSLARSGQISRDTS